MKTIKKSISLLLLIAIFLFIGNHVYSATLTRYDILNSSLEQSEYSKLYTDLLDEKVISRLEDPETYRYFTWGVVDGGIYYIKNKATGTYWTSPSGLGGNITLSQYNSSESQEFKIKYLGQDEYAFEPIQREGERARITSSSGNLTSYIKSYSSSYYRFRVTALNSTEYRISSKQSSFLSHLASSSSTIIQGSSTGNSSIWTFEKKDDRVHDSTKAYYIKDVNSGLYLTSISNTSSTLTFKEFRGDETQRFKRVYTYSSGASFYTYAPLINTDRRVNSYSSNLNAYYENQYIDYQKFSESYQGNLIYKINSFVDSQYIKVGLPYSTDEYYASKGMLFDSCDFNIIEAQFETPFVNWKPFDTQNISSTSTNYAQKNVLCFEAPFSGKYTIGMKRNTGTPIIGIFDRDGYFLSNAIITNGTNGQTIEANLVQGRIYYIYIIGIDNSNIFQYTSNLIKNLTAYLHGMNTYIADNYDINADRRTKFAIPGKEKVDNAFLYEGVINTNADMTANFVLNIDTSTGYIPLNAPVYFFRGHGNSNSVQYSTGTNTSLGTTSFIRNTDFVNTNGTVLFDMTSSRFVAWIGCETAGSVANGFNLTESTEIAGANSVLGFSEPISRAPATNFALRLIDNLIAGQTINTAVNNARSGIQFWFSGLGSYVIEGDASQTLTMTLGSGYVTRNSILLSEPDLTDYVLESITSNGVRRYVRYISGYPTNDYYDIMYDKIGGITYRYDSNTKIDLKSELDVQTIISAFNSKYTLAPSAIVFEDSMSFSNIIETNTYDYLVNYNGEYLPVRFIVTLYSNSQGYKTLDIKPINMFTKEVISEDILWERD